MLPQSHTMGRASALVFFVFCICFSSFASAQIPPFWRNYVGPLDEGREAFEAGNYPLAIAKIEESLHTFVRRYGLIGASKNSRAALIREELGTAYAATKDYASAVRWYREARETYLAARNMPGEDPKNFERSIARVTEQIGDRLFGVAEQYFVQKKYELAVQRFQQSAAELAKIREPGDPIRIRVASYLARSLQLSGKLGEALKVIEPEVEHARINFEGAGEDPSSEEGDSLWQVIHILAHIYHDLGRFEDAVIYGKVAYEIKAKRTAKGEAEEDEARSLATSAKNLGLAFKGNKEFEPAAEFLGKAARLFDRLAEATKNPKDGYSAASCYYSLSNAQYKQVDIMGLPAAKLAVKGFTSEFVEQLPFAERWEATSKAHINLAGLLAKHNEMDNSILQLELALQLVRKRANGLLIRRSNNPVPSYDEALLATLEKGVGEVTAIAMREIRFWSENYAISEAIAVGEFHYKQMDQLLMDLELEGAGDTAAGKQFLNQLEKILLP